MLEIVNIIKIAARYISTEAETFYCRVLENEYIIIDSSTPLHEVSVAEELEYFGFVFRQATVSGYNLLPTPFEILIVSLLNRIDWRYPPFSRISNRNREDLRNALMQIRGYMSKYDLVSLESTAISKTIEGVADIDAFISRILQEADDVCVVSAAEWSGNLPLVWAALVQRLNEGMRYKRIVSPLGLAAFGWEINYRDIYDLGVDLRVNLSSSLSPFYLFRGNKLNSTLVIVPPLNSKAQLRATYTTLRQLTEKVAGTFDDLWEKSVPAKSILEQLALYKNIYISNGKKIHGEAGARIASSLFNRGIFSEFTIEDKSIISNLVKSGLVIESKYTIGLTNCVPNIIDQIKLYSNK